MSLKVIVGLGNPGAKYRGTRHNVGFEALDRVAEMAAAGPRKLRFDAQTAECRIGDVPAILVWPMTFMNLSGGAVAQALAFYKAPLENLLVMCDDFHLSLGSLRLRPRGSSGGQNGLKDILARLADEGVSRLRIGVGPLPDRWDAADFVLSRFPGADADAVDVTLHRAADAAVCWATRGIEEAMNQYN